MSDFHQHGPLSTLQRLAVRKPGELAKQLRKLAKERAIVLVLPCHGPDLRSHTMRHIVRSLADARYLTHAVLSLNNLGPRDLKTARALAGRLPCDATILHNDSDAVRGVAAKFAHAVPLPENPGKGLNLWSAVGFLSRDFPGAALVAHDTDIRKYRPELLERLALPLVEPEMGYRFSKGYYHRAADRLYGRVTRLFFIPLVRAILRLVGHSPLIDFVDAFRYPLSGEFGGHMDLLRACRMAPGYGLETGLLCEAFRVAEPSAVCQVDIGPNFEHRHQSLGGESRGLENMCVEVAQTLLGYLHAEGAAIGDAFLRALPAAYRASAADSMKRYRDVAILNGFDTNDREEREAIKRFAGAIAHLKTTGSALQPPLLPAWATLDSRTPDFRTAFIGGAKV